MLNIIYETKKCQGKPGSLIEPAGVIMYNLLVVSKRQKNFANEWSVIMDILKGGVTAPEGFFATGVACGLKKDGRKDLAIVCSEDSAAVAGVFTTNKVKGHSLQLTMEHVKTGYANAIVINSGNANACVGEQGYEDALRIATVTSGLLDCEPDDILVASTGVIGERLNMDAIVPALEELVSNMGPDGGNMLLKPS